jgi:hypothetical protein
MVLCVSQSDDPNWMEASAQIRARAHAQARPRTHARPPALTNTRTHTLLLAHLGDAHEDVQRLEDKDAVRRILL